MDARTCLHIAPTPLSLFVWQGLTSHRCPPYCTCARPPARPFPAVLAKVYGPGVATDGYVRDPDSATEARYRLSRVDALLTVEETDLPNGGVLLAACTSRKKAGGGSR